MNTAARTLLDHVYDHEVAQPERVFLTQPLGGGRMADITWSQAVDEARRMAAHLQQALGVKRGDTVAMLAKNSAHFVIAELAIWMAGGTTVAIFPTETAENVRYVLQHSEARVLFVGKLDEWATQHPRVPEGVHCIALPLSPATGFETWEEVVARTEPLPGRPARGADDVAMLLYTSGSTGQPKGVMQTFGTVTAATHGIVDYNVTRDGGPKDHRILSYLPLSHVFECAWIECPLLLSGKGHLFFTESLATFMDDLKRARPTLFVSVPRLWSKFQQGVLARMPPAQLDPMLDNPATAAAVSKQVLASLGLDAVTRAGTGSAPMPPALLTWYGRLGLNITDGYGMTEDFGYSHASTAELRGPGRVGTPNPGVQTRLAEDGEILVRSPGQMTGYFKQPELTAESFTEDGFFKTGDLGRYDERGLLELTGRKKELFKTAKGKYVAPAPIEGRLAAHPMVELALVAGAGQRAAHAMVMLDENLRPKLGDAAVRAKVASELANLLETVNAAAPSYEHLQFIVVATEPWTMANGCLTPTMKIKRGKIEAVVAGAVAGWYEEAGPVLWS
ncbi:MAG: AMP-binding protein [Pseudomonadota bacterium]|nr:AMP-binding protein [Pseudomonadota bacterium]